MKPWKAQSESNDPPSWTQICPSCDNFDPKAFQTLVQQLFFDPHFATFFGVIPITPLFWVIPKPSFFPRTCGLPLGVAPELKFTDCLVEAQILGGTNNPGIHGFIVVISNVFLCILIFKFHYWVLHFLCFPTIVEGVGNHLGFGNHNSPLGIFVVLHLQGWQIRRNSEGHSGH